MNAYLFISSTSSFREWAARQDPVNLPSSPVNQPNDGDAAKEEKKKD